MRGSLTVQPSFDAALGSLRAFFDRLAASPPLALRPKPEPAAVEGESVAGERVADGPAAEGVGRDLGTVLARAPLQRWVAADTASFLAFLETSGCTLASVGPRFASLEAMAQVAVLDCFDAAR